MPLTAAVHMSSPGLKKKVNKWICPMGGQAPSQLLHATHPVSAPQVLHTVRPKEGGGDPATTSVRAPEPSTVAQALTPIGPRPLLAATGRHYMIYTAFTPCPRCSCLTFLRGKHGREYVLWKHPHYLLLLDIQKPIPGRLAGWLALPMGKGQARCASMSWHGSQALGTIPSHPDASVHCQPTATCLCSSLEQQGTEGGFSPKPEVNYALLDNFQLPVLAIKRNSSRWHAYLCTGREAPSACVPIRTPTMYFQGEGNLSQHLIPSYNTVLMLNI